VKHASVSSRRSRASSAVLAVMGMVTGSSALVSQEKHIDPASAAPASLVASGDVITLPDGKPVRTKLTKSVSTAIVKVGDNLELAVAETVRQEGLVIIPKGAVLSARVTSVRHAHRGSRNGSVSFSVENAVLPGGEVVALRPTAPVIAGQTVQDNLKTMGHLAVDPEFPPGGGIVLLAVAGPIMLFAKGHESVFYAGDDSYFPIRTKAGEEGVTAFESHLFGLFLGQRKEPPLHELAKDVNAEVYRMMILPTWGNSILVRARSA
jgi:hypothetical protein